VEEGLRCTQSELWDAFSDWVPDLRLSRIGRNTFYTTLLEYFLRKGNLFFSLSLRDPDDWEYLDKGDLSRVYLIGDGDAVKIGISFNPNYRLKVLQIGSSRELYLLASFPGGEKEETILHGLFREKHVRGEWFNLDEKDILKIFGFFSEVDLK